MKPNVLFIDDEKMVLEALRRSMRGKCDNWDVHYVDSTDALWELHAVQPFDVVVTDMHMPGTNGADLMRSLREKSPETVRIMLSGFKDRDEVARNESAHQFLMKPIMVSSLIHHIDQALQARLDDHRSVMLHGASHIVTSAANAKRLRVLLDKSDACTPELIALVNSDPGMSAKVLQLGNSGIFSSHTGDRDVDACLSVIGIELLRSLFSEETLRSFEADDIRDAIVEQAIGHARDIQARRPHESSAATLHVAGALLWLQQDDVVAPARFACDASSIELSAALAQLWGLPLAVVRELRRMSHVGCHEWARERSGEVGGAT